MRWRGWLSGSLAGAFIVAAVSGCVSVNEHRRLRAQHRTALAGKVAIEQELFDVRTANDSLRARMDSFGSEMETKAELLANLRKENSLLDEMRKTAQSTLEEMAGNQRLGDIAIAGPKLPAELDTALKRFSDEHPTAVTYDAARGTVKWKADLLFAIGSDVVKESSLESLRAFSEVIKSSAAAEFEVIVVGHTDNRPIVRPTTKAKHPTNWHLSTHRAIAVAFALQKYGYQTNRIGVMGYGEHRPIADNATQAGSSQNRRVEIYLLPRGAIVQASAGVATWIAGEALALVGSSR